MNTFGVKFHHLREATQAFSKSDCVLCGSIIALDDLIPERRFNSFAAADICCV